jgi:hypothetical protein
MRCSSSRATVQIPSIALRTPAVSSAELVIAQIEIVDDLAERDEGRLA